MRFPWMPLRSWGAVLAEVVLAAALVAVIAFILDRAGYISVHDTLESASSSASSAALPTEALFLNSLASKPDSRDEWWSARADHRLVAAAVLNCKHVAGVTVANAPRDYFSALLLDLDPSGAHFFKAESRQSSSAKAPASPASPGSAAASAGSSALKPLMLTGADQFALSLSDEVARARIAAASGAETSVPWVEKLGWSTVVVAALATLFVTLQGKMKPVEVSDRETGEGFWRRVLYVLIGRGASFRWVAFLAISLSITSTSLTGLKQVYDPTRTLTQNTRTLLALRQLHAEIIQGVTCGSGGDANLQTVVFRPDESASRLAGKFLQLRAAIIPDYGAYANLDLNVPTQANDDSRNARPAPEDVARTGSPPSLSSTSAITPQPPESGGGGGQSK
jgi:hypothetical protein